MPDPQSTIITALLEQLITTGPESMGQVFTASVRSRHAPGARTFPWRRALQRSPERQGYANGYKPKSIDTPAGTLTVHVPKTAGMLARRSTRSPWSAGGAPAGAVMLAIAEMYVQGVSTRDAAKVMAEFGLNSLSSMQVSRAAALLGMISASP